MKGGTRSTTAGGRARGDGGQPASRRTARRAAFTAIVVVMLGAGGGLPVLGRLLPADSTAQAATATAIQCNGQPFISRDAWRLSNADTASATFTEGPAVATAASPTRYNALGFNVRDGNIYGIYGGTAVNGTGNQLTRITPSGTIQNLGPVTGLPIGISYQAGDVDENGIMWVKPVNVTTALYRIDLNVTPYRATAVTLSAAVGIEDLAYNPTNGLLYGWTYNPVGRIAEINPTTGAVVQKNPAGLDTQANGEAVWFDGLGNMHVAFRDIGDVYQFSNLASATPTATKISDRNAALAATDNSMDAAGCPYAPTVNKAFSPTTLSSAAGSTATLTFTIRNVLDGTLAVDLTDTLPTGLVYDAGSLVVGNATGTPNAYDGTTSLAVTGITVPPNSTVTVTITVRTSGNNVGGTLNNQARLTVPTTQADPLIPTGVKGATIFSNNPATALINEPTPISVYDSVECSARWYYWHGTGAANGGGLGWWNTATAPWAGGGAQLSALAGGPYEIMEYNVQDGFFYTLPATGNTLYSVDAGERTRNLGTVAGLPATFAVAGAAFSESGALYVKAGGATNVIYRIDVTTRVATAITLSASVNVQDLAIDPFDSTRAYAITTAGQLATINLTTGAVSLKTITGGANVTDSEALWFDSSGTLYAINQATNDVYAITNLTSATATATRVSGDRAGAFGTDGTIDGTSCPYAPLARKSWSPASLTPPATSQLTISVVNPLDVAVDVDIADVLPSTLVQYVDGTLAVSNGSGTPNAYGGTQNLTITGVTLPANGTTTITITVSNPLPLGGIVDNQATVTVPAGQPGVPATLADQSTVSDNPATTTVFQDKTRLVMSGPLPCDNRAYIMQQRSGESWGSMYGLDQTVADPTLELLYPQSPTTGANVNPASQFNGIGYNVVDGYIYGSVGSVSAGQPASIGAYDIVRIDGAGNAVYINVTRPASVSTASTWSHVGDVSAGGLFYRPLDYTSGGDGIEIIDLNNIDYGTSPPSVSSTVVRLAQQFPGAFADWAFNPTDGLLYASYTDASTNPNTERLVRINPITNGTASFVGTYATPGAGAGAVWFDAFGSFYSYHNSNAADATVGSIVRWDNPNTATPKATLVDDDFPATAGNDGARCAYYPGFTKDVAPRIAPAGAVVTYTYTIRNGYPAGGANITADFVDTMTDGRTYVPGTVTINGQVAAGTPTLSAGDTQLDIAEVVVGAQQSATITVQVQTDPNTPDLPATVYNQATINGAVVQPVVSDYPGTDDVLDDATPLVLVEPLDCTDEAYLTHNVAPDPVATFDRLTGEQTTISDGTDLVLNSLAYNPLDGLLYSLNATAGTVTTNDLYVIDAAGNLLGLGDVTGLPDTQNYNGGTFDTQGRLWVKTNLASSTLLYAIDVATRTATQYATSVAVPNFADFAYNPLDGKIYAFNWISDTQATITAIDVSAAGTTKPTTVATFDPPDTVDSLAQAQWIDGTGNLFVRASTDGEVWMIEPLTAAAQMLSIGTAATGGADGASCPRPELLKDVNPDQVVAGEPATYTFRITNPTPGTLSLGMLDNQDSGRVFVDGTLTITDEGGATVAPASYAVNAYGGTGMLDIDSVEVPSGNVFTVTVQVRTGVTTPGGTLLNQASLTDLAAQYGTVLSDFPDTLDTFDDATPLAVLGAQIDVEKSHTITTDDGQPGAADAGDIVTYAYLVTNTGEVPLTIEVRDLIEGTTTLTASCPVTTLATGASTTCTAPYTVSAGDIAAQGDGDDDLDNVVTATGTTAPGGVVSDGDIDVVPLAQAASGLVIDKSYAITTDGGTPGIAEPGDVISYTYRITNTGTVWLTGVSAIDTHEGTGTPKPGTLTCTNTMLVPNQTGTCTATYTVVQGDVDTIADGFLDDVVRVTATTPSGSTLAANDGESVPLPAPHPSITVDKTYSITADAGVTGAVDANDVVTYSFAVVNNGNVTLDNVGVTDVRERNPQLVVTCPVTTLAPGESTTCTTPGVTVTTADALAEQTDADSPRSIGDVATARGTEEGTTNVVSDTDEEAVPVTVLQPIYSATKTSSVDGGNGFVEPSEQITYTITITNDGLVEATNVPVTDPVPADTSFVSATGGGTLNTSTTPPRVEWTVPSITANGGTATVTFTVQAAAVIPDEVTAIGNQATIDGSTPTCAAPDEDGDPLTCDPTIDYVAKPSIDVEKSHTIRLPELGQAGVADVGDVIDYSYRVTNTGNVPLDPITVSDSLEGATAIPADCGAVTSLAVGASVTCTLPHQVTQGEFDARGGGDSDLDNTVATTGTFGTITVTAADDDVVQLAQPASGIVVDKSYVITGDGDSDGLADVGDTVTYTYVITNTGTVTLTNVRAVDDHEGDGTPVPGVLTCLPITLAPNATSTCTATYTVVQNDVDNQGDTSLDDTVTAIGTPPTGPDVSGTDSESVPLPLAEPAINVDKTWVISPDLGTAGVVDTGDTVHYSYTITNNGNVTLNVVGGDDVHELLGTAPITCPTVALAPGQSTTCISQWTATQAELFAEQSDTDSPRAVTDAVAVSGTAPDGDIVSDTDDEVVPLLTLAPAIDVEKDHALSGDVDGDGFADEGDTIQYTFTVRNTGLVALSGLSVEDSIEGATPIAADCGPVTGLAVGASTTCFWSHVVTAADAAGWGGGDGDVDDTVTATAGSVNGSVSDSDDDVVQLAQAAPGLSVEKTAAIDPDVNANGIADEGDTVVYTYAVTNTGLSPLTLTSAIDDQETAGDVALTCPDPALDPNETATCDSTSHTVTAADLAGQADRSLDDVLRVTATDGATTLLGIDSESVPVPVSGPAITVDKTWVISPDGGTPGVMDAGDMVTYTYRVTNNGNVTLTNVGLVDTQEITGDVEVSCAASTLAAGSSTTCTSTFPATQADVLFEQTDTDTRNSMTDAATATGQDPLGYYVADTDDEAVPVAALLPAIDVAKSHAFAVPDGDADGDGFADVGDQIVYSYVVTNTGTADLTGLLVTDVLEGGSATDVCPGVTALAVGASTTCTLAYPITQADLDGAGGGDGDLDNTVTAIATSINGNLTDTDDDVVQLAQAAPGLSVDKEASISNDVNGDGIADAGDEITYTYVITNGGNVTLTGVGAVDDQESAGPTTLACASTTLAPGESTTCDATTYPVTQPDIDGQTDPTLDDVVTATGTPPSGPDVTATDSESVPLPAPAPALSVGKTFAIDPDGGAAGFVDAGDEVDYTYAVTNNGNVTLTNVGVADSHEIGGTLIAACLSTTLAVGESTTCSASYTATTNDVYLEQTDADTMRAITDIATASGAAPDGNVVTDTDDEAVPVVVLPPAIDVEKTHAFAVPDGDADGDGFADAGDVIVYTYAVTNTGGVDLASVAVGDVLEGIAVPDASCPGTTLAVNTSMECTSPHTITQAEIDAAGGGDGDLDNTVTVSGVSVNGTASDSDDDVVQLAQAAPGLVVDKTAAITIDGGTLGVAEAGDIVSYDYTITNTGNVTLTDVGAIDVHEAVGSLPLTCAQTTLAPGASTACSGTVFAVTQPVVDGPARPTLDDTVIATGTPPQGGPVTATDSESVPLPAPAPAITVDKTYAIAPDGGSTGMVDAGDTVAYTYVVTNNGNVTLGNVGVLDAHETAGLLTATCAATTLAPGTSTTCSATYDVTAADVLAEQSDPDTEGAITDVATAAGTAPTGNVVTDPDDEAVAVAALPAGIDVEKSHAFAQGGDADGDGFADAGDTIVYTYLVTNTGQLDLTTVVVADVLEGNTVTVDCQNADTIGVGGSITCTSTHTVTPAEIDAFGGGDLDLDNTVTATGESVNGQITDTDTDVVALGTGTTVADAGIGVQKSWVLTTDTDADGLGDAGDVVTYTYVVTNTGREPLSNLIVDDDHEGAGTPVPDLITGCSSTTIEPNGSVTCTATYTLVAGDFPGDDWSLDDTVVASAQKPDATTVQGVDSESVPLAVTTPNTPAITLDKEWSNDADADGDGIADAGDTVTYTFRIVNNGTVDLTAVGVTDLTEGSPQLAVDCGGVTTLAAGAATVCTAGYLVTGADTAAEQADADSPLLLADVATAAGTAPGGNVVHDTDEEGVPVPFLAASIDVEKSHTLDTDTDGDGFADVGDVVRYEYAVTNTGTNAELTDLVVEDALEGAAAVDADCDSTTSLAAGESVTCFTLHAVAPDEIAAFGGGDLDLDNEVTATASSAVGQVTDRDTDVVALGTGTSLSDAGIGVQKSWALATDANGNGLAETGDVVQYTYVVTNTGSEPLTDLVVDDDHEGTGTPKPDVISCPDTTLDPGESVTCSAGYTLTGGDVPGVDWSLDDTVVVTAQGNGTTVHGVDAESVPVAITAPNTPAITLDKEWTFDNDADSDGIADAGDVIEYSFRIVNNGTVELTAVGVTDVTEGAPQLAIECGGVTTLAADASMTCTATYPVSEADVDAEQLDADSPLLLADVATAAGTAPGGNVVRDTDEEAVPVPLLYSELSSAKTVLDASGDGLASPGEVLTYTIGITNAGTADAVDQPFADPLDANTTFVSGSVTIGGIPQAGLDPAGGFPVTIPAESSVVVTFQVTVASPLDPAPTTIANQSTIGGEPSCADLIDPCEPTTIPVGRPGVALAKSHVWLVDRGQAGAGDAGDLVRYDYVVTNTGDTALVDIQLVDSHEGAGPLSALICPTDTLAAGQSTTCTATYTVTQDDIDTYGAGDGIIPNDAEVTGLPPAGPAVTATASDQITISTSTPQVAIDKEYTIDPDGGQVGLAEQDDTVHYTYLITNTGNVTLTGVQLVDDHEGLTSVVVASCGPATTLAPGAQLLCSGTYVVTAADQTLADGRIDDEATATGTAPDGTTATSSDEEGVPVVVAVPAITLDKSWALTTDGGTAGLADAGDQVTYTYTVTNNGNVALDPVSLSDVHSGTGPFTAPVCPVTSLAAGAATTCDATYTVTQADVDAGNVISDVATAAGTPPAGPGVSDLDGEAVPVTPALPSVALDKVPAITTDSGTPGVADAGDVITYTYTVTNTGNVTLHDIRVADVHSGTGSLGAIACPATSLAPGASTACTTTYTVTAQDVAAGGTIVNVATVTATPPKGGPVTGGGQASVPVVGVAALTIDKSATFTDTATPGTAGSLDPGEVATYQFVVRNTGNIPVDGIVVTDVHEGSTTAVVVSCPATSLLPGQQMVCTATHTVSDADLLGRGGGDGTLDDTATAAGTTRIGPVTSPPDGASLPLTEPHPAVTLEKRAVGAATSYQIGQTVQYEIVVTNTGNVTLTNVAIVDVRIPDLDCSGFDGSLAPGESVTCTGSLVVTQADVDAGRVTNTATVSADSLGAQGLSAADTAEVQAVPPPPPATVPPPPSTTPPPPSELPATGGNSTPTAGVAAGLVLLGALLVLVAVAARRRRRAAT